MREGTLKQLNVKVGDKVRPIKNSLSESINGILLVLTHVDHTYYYYKAHRAEREEPSWDVSYDSTIFRLEEEAVEIKVGDEVEVFYSNMGEWKGGYTVLAVQDKDKNDHRHWIVVAFMGDIPEVFTPDKVRKPKPKPVVEEVVVYGNANYGSWSCGMSFADVDTHKITFNLVDDEPDCNSIKMVKL